MKIDPKKLRFALDNLKSVIGRRNTLPILSTVKLHTDGNGLNLSVTNLDEFAVERVEADGEIKPVCVGFNHLHMALFGETCEIIEGKGAIVVKCGEDETELSTMPATEFVEHPTMKGATNHGVACPELAASIKSVGWAAATDQTRYILLSVHIKSSAKMLTVTSTNGRELATVETPLIGSDFEIVFPSEYMGNFCAALARPGAIMASNDKQIHVSHDAGEYICKMLEGNYPNYKQVIPAAKNLKALGTVSTAEFLAVVSSCIGYSNDTEAKGTYKFTKKGLTIEFLGDNNARLVRHLAGNFADFTVALATKKMARI